MNIYILIFSSPLSPFTLLIASFDEQKFLILMYSSLSIISFVGTAFSILFRKSLAIPSHADILPFFSTSFLVQVTFTKQAPK